MKPDELIKYLQNQDPMTNLPMSPDMATGQMPGVPALPGMSQDSGHSMVKSPYPPLEGSGPNEEEEMFADGGIVPDATTPESEPTESPIILKLRELLMGKKGDLMADQNQVQKADAVDNSYANGGMVDKMKDYVSKAYGKAKKGPMIDDSTLQGFQNLVSSPTAQGVPPQTNGYASGGFPTDPLLMPGPADFGQALNPASIPQPQFDPKAGLPPTPPVVPPQVPVNPPVKVPVQPSAAPQPVQGANPYFAQQKAELGKYGPEQQLALVQALQKQQNGLGGRVPVALGGLADALMQGVARAGNPGFADRIQGQQNNQAAQQISALENAGKVNKENLEGNAQIDSMDPSSQLSKVAQNSYGPLLIKNGFKPQQVQGMSAKNIADLTGKTVEALKAESEAKMAAATLGLHQQEAANTVRHQKTEEELAQEARVQSAGKELSEHPIQRVLGILPGQSGLEKMVNGGNDSTNQPAAPQINSQVEYDSLPKGAVFMWNGKQGRKP